MSGLDVMITVGVMACFCCAAYILYRRVFRRLGGRASLPFLLLRCTALSLFALILLKPDFACHSLSFKPTLVVLIDRSASMSFADCLGGKRRFDTALRLWREELRDELSSDFEVRELFFDAEPVPVPAEEAKLEADGRTSNIIISARKAAEGAVALILFSDGRDTSALSRTVKLPDDMPPVFTVGVGSKKSKSIKDVSVTLDSVPQTVYRKTSFTVSLAVSSSGYGRFSAPITLYEDDAPVLTQTVEIEEGENLVKLSYAPQDSGLHSYRVKMPVKEGELLKENNETGFYIRVVESDISVFYAEGVPRWEYKFVKQVLSEDPNIRFTGSVRIGTEDFSIQGSKGKVRIRGALPADKEELKKFKILILGDIPRPLLSEEQLIMVEEFVNEGGTLIVIGGENILSAEYRGSRLAALLPIRLEGTPQKVTTPFLPTLTQEGRNHPIFEGYQRYFETAETPATVETLFVAGAPKPGAVELAVHPSLSASGRAAPLLLLQNYGEGRVILIATDTLWRWYFKFRSLGLKSPYVRFFGQMARWAAEAEDETDAPLVIRLSSRFVETGEPLTVEVEPRGGVLPESVTCELKTKDGEDVSRIRLSGSGSSFLTGSLTVERPGEYRIVAEGADRGGKQVLVETSIVVGNPYAEFRYLTLNEELLKKLASQTRGAYFRVTEMRRLLAEMEMFSESMATSASPFWQHPLLFLLMLLAIGSEYVFRKRKGLT